MNFKKPEDIAAARALRAENEKKHTPEQQLAVLVASVNVDEVERVTKKIMDSAVAARANNSVVLVSLVGAVESMALQMGISRTAVRALADGIEKHLGGGAGPVGQSGG